MEDSHQLAGSEIQQKWQTGIWGWVQGWARESRKAAEGAHSQAWSYHWENIPQCLTQIRHSIIIAECVLCARACTRGEQSQLNMVSVCLQRTHEEYVELLCAKNIIDIIHSHYHLRGAMFWSFSLFRQKSWDSTDLIISSRCHIKLVTDLGPKFTRWVCESFKALCSFFPYHTGLPDQVESANDPEKGILAG